jgi:nitroreductase
MRAALELASRAPSLHNSQPWRWRIADASIHLYADTDRQLPVVDPIGRELVISCGAVLHHARVAFASLGWQALVHRLPNPAEPGHLAAIEFNRVANSPEPVVAMASAAARRHTDRRPFLPDSLPPGLLDDLMKAAADEHVTLTVVDSPQALRELVVAFSHVNAVQRDDFAYLSELRAWAGRSRGATEGVPANEIRGADASRRGMLGRNFGLVSVGELGAPPMDDGATLAVLSTDDDKRASWLRTGEALSAVLLIATAAGLASCTLSQVAELSTTRHLVRAAVLGGAGEPQLAMRIGWPVTIDFPAPLAPRRPLSEIVDRMPSR